MNELRSFESDLETLDNPDLFTSYIMKRSMGAQFLEYLGEDDPDWQGNWEKYQQKIKEVCQSLIAFVNRCCTEDKVLWVKGY
jgi:hypothetical protein